MSISGPPISKWCVIDLFSGKAVLTTFGGPEDAEREAKEIAELLNKKREGSDEAPPVSETP